MLAHKRTIDRAVASARLAQLLSCEGLKVVVGDEEQLLQLEALAARRADVADNEHLAQRQEWRHDGLLSRLRLCSGGLIAIPAPSRYGATAHEAGREVKLLDLAEDALVCPPRHGHGPLRTGRRRLRYEAR